MNPSPELEQLVIATKKQLEHLRVLGVEGIRLDVTAANPIPIPEKPTSLFGDLTPTPQTLTQSTETLAQIHAEVGDCTRCPLHLERTHVVHTEGNRKARLMFVGEA